MPGTVDASAINNVTLANNSGTWDDIGGGPGSLFSTDQPIEGSHNRARRIDNNVRGFTFDNGSGIDISASGTHVGFWLNVFQPALIGTAGCEMILGGGATPTTSPWSGWEFQAGDYPATGGWLRIWLDPTITRDTGTGTLNLASVRQYGTEFDMGDISGTSESCHLDRIDYTATGLLVDGGTVPSPASIADFVAADFDNSSNRYGVIIERDGIRFVLARLTIADATATVFSDSGSVIVFPSPPTTNGSVPFISTDFMGITSDLQNASTDITFALGIFRSSDNVTGRQGDFIVTGTSGSLAANSCTFDRIRVITLTSGCTFTDCSVTASGLITLGGATFTGCTVNASTVTGAAMLWDTNADPDGELDNLTVVTGPPPDTQHALELGTNTPTTITLTGHTYTNFHSMADPTTDVTFNTETGIDSGTDIVTTDKVHEYSTADPVWVQDQGGTETPGLSDSTRYYVNAQSTTTLSFHTSVADANSDSNRVNLTASGAGNGEVWELYSGHAVIFNNSGKSITLNVAGGGNTPTVRNGDGSSTTVQSTLTLTLTGLVSGSEVRIYQAGTTTEEDGIESSGTSFAYQYNNPPGFNVDIKIHKEDYEHLPIYNLVLSTSADADLPIQQRIDRTYNNP